MSKLTLDNLTVGDLHAALQMPRHLTIADALAGRAQAEADYAASQQQERAYDAFVNARNVRRQAAIAEAVEHAISRAENATRPAGSFGFRKYRIAQGIETLSPAERAQIARDTATDAGSDFDRQWPALDMDDWHRAGMPEIYETGALERTGRRVKAAMS